LNVDTIPKGVGSREKHVPHDLFWSGGSPLAGYWYVLVTNSNAAPVDYKLISTFGVSDPKDCFQYYEYYQNGAYVLWTECNRPKPP